MSDIMIWIGILLLHSILVGYVCWIGYKEFKQKKEKSLTEEKLYAPLHLEIERKVLDILDGKTDWFPVSVDGNDDSGFYRIIMHKKNDEYVRLCINYENGECFLNKRRFGYDIFEHYFTDEYVKNKLIGIVNAKNNKANELKKIIDEL